VQPDEVVISRLLTQAQRALSCTRTPRGDRFGGGRARYAYICPARAYPAVRGRAAGPVRDARTAELGDRLEPHLAGHEAWLLANHGAVTVGATLDAAWIRMESLEHGARIIWTARTLGGSTN